MQEFSSVSFSTSEQHRDVRSARQEWDTQRHKLIAVISPTTPFSCNPSLCCQNTGACAEEHVNADQALQVGNQTLDGLYGCEMYRVMSSRRRIKWLLWKKRVEVSIGGEKICIDPRLLFQCLVTAWVNSGELKEVFLYEPCSYPPALFESQHAVLEADKDALADNIWKALPMKDPELPQQVTYVRDGGWLHMWEMAAGYIGYLVM